MSSHAYQFVDARRKRSRPSYDVGGSGIKFRKRFHGMTTQHSPRQRVAKPIRIGIVGCGAITENSHLPASLASSLVELTVLCDMNLARADAVKRQFGLSVKCCADYQDLFGKVDAVVLALPNHLHASCGCAFLERGIHVLCEKPLATSVLECEQMCAAAEATGAVLAVGYVTRYYPSTELSCRLLQDGFLEKLESLDYEFGTAGGWAPLSAYNLCRGTSGGGVLTVTGSHILDRMLYFFGEPRILSYADDSRGGVEANCVAEFELTSNGAVFPGTVTLSKTHNLGNRLRVVGQRGTLIVHEGQKQSVMFWPAKCNLRHEIQFGESNTSPPLGSEYYFQVQLEDFVAAVQSNSQPRTDGAAGLRSVRLTEECYRQAVPIDEPWVDSTLARLTETTAARKSLPALHPVHESS
jgi:predicted dehydrogenase